MTTYYLEMSSPDALVSAAPIDGLKLDVIDPPDPRISQRFYREVGAAWQWTDRADWPLEDWRTHLEQDPMVTLVLRIDHREAGYAEVRNVAGDVEIVNFGLLAPFIGRGLGGAFLVEVVRKAWTLPNVHRVWLHTCDQDHPNALANYQRRGFTLYRKEES